MDERKISEHESLHLIQQMIQVAKENHRENGEGWLIWGWLLFVASVISGVLVYLKIDGFFSWVWTATLFVVCYLVPGYLLRTEGSVVQN